MFFLLLFHYVLSFLGPIQFFRTHRATCIIWKITFQIVVMISNKWRVSILVTALLQGTGNMLLDMEQQLQANSIRINVLKQEKATLHNSIVKLRERAQKTASRVGLICNVKKYLNRHVICKLNETSSCFCGYYWMNCRTVDPYLFILPWDAIDEQIVGIKKISIVLC